MSTAKATPLGTNVSFVRTLLIGQINQKFAALSIDERLERATHHPGEVWGISLGVEKSDNAPYTRALFSF